jgi:hypothetical protein
MLLSLLFLFAMPTVAFMLSDNPIVAFVPIVLVAPLVLLASKLNTERGRSRLATTPTPAAERSPNAERD